MSKIRPVWRIVLGFLIFLACVYNTIPERRQMAARFFVAFIAVFYLAFR